MQFLTHKVNPPVQAIKYKSDLFSLTLTFSLLLKMGSAPRLVTFAYLKGN
jgi:hypothetical protein